MPSCYFYCLNQLSTKCPDLKASTVVLLHLHKEARLHLGNLKWVIATQSQPSCTWQWRLLSNNPWTEPVLCPLQQLSSWDEGGSYDVLDLHIRLLVSIPSIADRRQSPCSLFFLLHRSNKAVDKAQDRQISSMVAQAVVPSEADLYYKIIYPQCLSEVFHSLRCIQMFMWLCRSYNLWNKLLWCVISPYCSEANRCSCLCVWVGFKGVKYYG